VGQNREAELIRERERIRNLRLDRCDNLEPGSMWGERPQHQDEPRDDMGMDPPIPDGFRPPSGSGSDGPTFPDHDPPVM
jgi:hypothetical protein